MPEDFFSTSPGMDGVLQSGMQVAQTDACVMILGESGTGKERLARAIHQVSPRSTKPFITVNCAALPSTLAESLLFGHTKGAFTGASEQNPGLIMAADGGTLFLDEIGELSLMLQPKLLRFLELGEILPIGRTRPVRVNVRVLTATHCDLRQMVHAGTFRQDLFHRINVIPLQLPPLRQRKDDIEPLANHFLAHFSVKHRQLLCTLGVDAIDLLRGYVWPGNARELRNLCEQLSILRAGCTITPDDLMAAIRRPLTGGVDDVEKPFMLPEGGIDLEEMERHFLIQALERSFNNKTHAARLLGISRDALNYRLKKHGLA